MFASLATALVYVQAFSKSTEVIDIVPNVVRNNRAAKWCVGTPMNLNKASVYK